MGELTHLYTQVVLFFLGFIIFAFTVFKNTLFTWLVTVSLLIAFYYRQDQIMLYTEQLIRNFFQIS